RACRAALVTTGAVPPSPAPTSPPAAPGPAVRRASRPADVASRRPVTAAPTSSPPRRHPHRCVTTAPRTSPLLQQPRQQSLLHRQPVGRLFEDGRGRAVHHLVGDLLTPVGGQAVQHDR